VDDFSGFSNYQIYRAGRGTLNQKCGFAVEEPDGVRVEFIPDEKLMDVPF
jgi:hypothetical protein